LILADHKVYEVHNRLVYVCTGCGSIGEVAPLGDTTGLDITEYRNMLVNTYAFGCCGLVFTFAGVGER
jgi:Fe-S oxidoreductase